MFHDDSQKQIDRFTRGIIHRKINQLIGRAGFKEQDRKDLEQDLILRLLQALPSFDPQKAHRNVFVTTVIERCVANILRDKQAEKRDHRRIGSLNETVDIGEGERVDMSQAISQREYNARRCYHPRSDEELAQLEQDVAEVIAKLPDKLRELAEQLKSQTVTEVARDTGTPRTTLYESVHQLRTRFEKVGLKNYL